MRPRRLMILAALLAAASALFLLFVTVQATSPGDRVLACGNGFTTADLARIPPPASDLSAEFAKARLDVRYGTLLDGYQAVCGQALSARRWVGYGILAGSGVALLVLLVARRGDSVTGRGRVVA